MSTDRHYNSKEDFNAPSKIPTGSTWVTRPSSPLPLIPKCSCKCVQHNVDRQLGYTCTAALTLWMQSQTHQCARGPDRTGWDISVAYETPAGQQYTHDPNTHVMPAVGSGILMCTRMVQCLCLCSWIVASDSKTSLAWQAMMQQG